MYIYFLHIKSYDVQTLEALFSWASPGGCRVRTTCRPLTSCSYPCSTYCPACIAQVSNFDGEVCADLIDWVRVMFALHLCICANIARVRQHAPNFLPSHPLSFFPPIPNFLHSPPSHSYPPTSFPPPSFLPTHTHFLPSHPYPPTSFLPTYTNQLPSFPPILTNFLTTLTSFQFITHHLNTYCNFHTTTHFRMRWPLLNKSGLNLRSKVHKSTDKAFQNVRCTFGGAQLMSKT